MKLVTLLTLAVAAAAASVNAAPQQQRAHLAELIERSPKSTHKASHKVTHKKMHKKTAKTVRKKKPKATAKPRASTTTKPVIKSAGSTAAPALGTSRGANPEAATSAPSKVAPSAAAAAATGAYYLNQSNRGSSFFSNNNWNFWTASDPTHGAVTYQSQSDAQSQGLIGVNNNQAFVSTSTANLATGANRPSVRMFSKNTWNSGLIILDVAKMPVGCATWPALWTYNDDNWPSHGEIDIMEGIGYTSAGTNENLVTVHLNQTSPINTDSSLYSGSTLEASDCNTNYGGGNTGCAFRDGNAHGPSWGPNFNSANGGVWAMQFGKNNGIKVWFWGRGQVPAALSTGTSSSPSNLDPSSWGKPMANFQSQYINNQVTGQQFVLDITVGGDWAGNVPMDGNCGSDYQAAYANGANYADAKFVFNGIDVYCAGSANGC